MTVLCVGLAGEADPEAAATGVDRLLTSLEMLLGRYEASLDRVLGDSVIAVFGARQLHEDDAERAVQAARALVEETRRQAGRRSAPQVSVGVATGEAYFGPVGRGGQATHSVLGPLVNRAARLQGRAAAGQVLADQATYRRTHQAFAYRSPDSAGTPASAQAYEVAGALARPAKTRGIEGLRAELIGRDEELAKLEAALARVRAGQGQVVSLISEAGLGKSRLVAELKARCDSSEPATLLSMDRQSTIPTPQSAIAWLEGRCLEMASSTSYGPFVDLLHGHFTATDAVRGEPPALAAAIRSELYALRDANLLADDQVEEIGPLLGNLLSVNFGDDWDERLRFADPAQIRHRTFAALRAFFGALAAAANRFGPGGSALGGQPIPRPDRRVAELAGRPPAAAVMHLPAGTGISERAVSCGGGAPRPGTLQRGAPARAHGRGEPADARLATDGGRAAGQGA